MTPKKLNKLNRFREWCRGNPMQRLSVCPFCEDACIPQAIRETLDLVILSSNSSHEKWFELRDEIIKNYHINIVKFLSYSSSPFYSRETESIEGIATELKMGTHNVLFTSSYILEDGSSLSRYGRPSCEQCNDWVKIGNQITKIRNLGVSERREQTIRETKTKSISRMDIYQRDNGICYLCGKSVDPDNFHLDHVIPLTWKWGGTHTEDNIKITHPECNMRKHAKAQM